MSVPECLEELGVLIQNNGMIVCGPQPQKTVPLMAAQISDRDNTVRSAALNTLVVVYNNMGEAVYKYTSQVSLCYTLIDHTSNTWLEKSFTMMMLRCERDIEAMVILLPEEVLLFSSPPPYQKKKQQKPFLP